MYLINNIKNNENNENILMMLMNGEIKANDSKFTNEMKNNIFCYLLASKQINELYIFS
jgi:hypothetical protein